MICYDRRRIFPKRFKSILKIGFKIHDVLDTWFSSALWPFALSDGLIKHLNLNKFYPNSTLVTGHDILFFWVARMILMGEYAMGQVPFP